MTSKMIDQCDILRAIVKQHQFISCSSVSSPLTEKTSAGNDKLDKFAVSGVFSFYGLSSSPSSKVLHECTNKVFGSTMTGMSLKLKSKNGQHVLTDLTGANTVRNLKARISEITQIPESLLNILVGFPPKPLDLSKESDKISSIGISSGDTLIVEEMLNTQKQLEEDEKLAQRLSQEEEMASSQYRSEGIESGVIASSVASSGAEVPNDDDFTGILLKKVVPADNSCLFTSIGYVLNNKIDTNCATFMRDIIAQQVASDPETYNEAFLGKPNREYCDWIRHPDSWGGAIEVSILSNFYGVEIAVVDITNTIINRFGEDRNFGVRVFLLFDGIHYDPLYLETPGGNPKTIFPVEELSVFQQAEQLAIEAKSSRQFTDVNRFTLRCMQCDTLLIGQGEAQQHALITGHDSFGEV